MSVLRGLAWPHLIPSKPESTSNRSPGPSAVRDIVDRIENQNSRRRSSYGDQPETPPSRTLPSRPHLHSRASDPNLPTIPSAILSSRISSPSYVGPETILRRYTTVPIPGHKRTRSNVNQLSPRTPVRMGSEAEHTLPSLLPANPPLDVLEPNPFQDPFDDLIQSMPDAPIGGQAATPLATPIPGGEENDGMLEVASSPHIEVVSPSREESRGSSEQDSQTQAGHLDPSGKAVSLASKTPGFWSKRPAEILNNSSHSSRARRKKRKHNSKGRTKSPRAAVVSGSSQETPSSPFSDSAALPDTSGDYFDTSGYTSGEGSKIGSPSYVTAQQTPLPPSEQTPQQRLSSQGQKSHQTRPPLTRPPLKTFGKPQSTPILNMGKPNGVPDLSHTDDLASGLDGDQPPPCCDPPSNVPSPLREALVAPLPSSPNDVEDQQTSSEMPTQVPEEGYPFPAAPAGLVPSIPNPSNKPSAPVPGIPEIPAGDLSRLPTPELPIKRKKANVVSRGMRQGRRIVLRSPVLAVVLGRQLSKPTAVALKAIAKGLPLEEVSDAAGAAPTSGPAHV